MEKVRKITPIGSDKVKCNLCCGGKYSEANSKGKEVCDLLGAPAIEGIVSMRMNSDLKRICTLLNPDINNQT